MLKHMLIAVALLLTVDVVLANPASEGLNFNVTSLDKILHIEDGFLVSSTRWSPDGQYLLVTCSKSISRSNSIHKHYLLDINSHTFGEINYGIKEFSSYSIPTAEWSPYGDRIYFKVSRFAGTTDFGNCYIVCNPDGTNLRGVGTNFTDLPNIIKNLKSIGSQNNLEWSPDSSKAVFEWQKTGNIFSGVYLANENGTSACEIRSNASQPAWCGSNKIFFVIYGGNVLLVDCEGNTVQAFNPEKEERYVQFLLSPDRARIMFTSIANNSFSLYTYISNIDGSKLKGNFSHDEDFWANESWQPNGSLLLVNQDGNLYIINGKENNKSLLYKGNATKPQWFPNGKKILFVENKNKLYSIGLDGTNLTFITDFGLTTSFFWSVYDEAKQFSINPSGNIIAFTSALYPDTGKIIEYEPDPSTRQNIAVPLFLINSDGSNLTQVTSTIKGKYDIFGEWSPNGRKFTIGSVLFSKDRDLGDGVSSLVELDAQNSSSNWRNMAIRGTPGGEEPVTIDKTQNDEFNSINTSQVAEHKETSKQSPSFLFLQLFASIMGIWLLHKSREL